MAEDAAGPAGIVRFGEEPVLRNAPGHLLDQERSLKLDAHREVVPAIDVAFQDIERAGIPVYDRAVDGVLLQELQHLAFRSLGVDGDDFALLAGGT